MVAGVLVSSEFLLQNIGMIELLLKVSEVCPIHRLSGRAQADIKTSFVLDY